jgi:radical SAM family uncharacterized protein/radical SAM-linked protein
MKDFEEILSQITRPSRYLGNEINSVHKNLDQMTVKVLLAFPDVYEVGMSHLGFQILYHILNGQEDVGAERVFAPWVDMEKALRARNLPLFSLESRVPIDCFDIIGFSLQYELSYSNVLTMLDLGDIPLLSKERDEHAPLIIGGGPCAFNPEPVADFFDALVIGEGEEVIVEIIDVYKKWRTTRRDRAHLLDLLTAIPGVYVPSKFDVAYTPQGSIREIMPLKPGHSKIRKRVVADLDNVSYPTDFIVPFASIVHDRINLEVARGCTRGCRFCQAGMLYRPVRERSCSNLEQIAATSFEHTGWEEMSLLSLSSGDYSGAEKLLDGLINRFSHHHVSVSLPSLRAETLRSNLVEAIKRARKTGFTIAPETGTDRLRRFINKGLTDAEILETCQRVFQAGWSKIKLYFMIGLPTETKKDLEGIIQLAEQAWTRGKGVRQKRHITVSVSTFIPKPHTPFQWTSMISVQEIRERQTYLRNLLRRNRFNFKWQDPHMSILEGIMARGDRRLGKVIVEAYRQGARFDGWTDCFDYPTWEKAFDTTGIDMNFYLGAKDETEILPWDHIECGVTKSFLRSEYAHATREEETSDCRWNECHECGVCDFTSLYPRIAPNEGTGIEKGSENETQLPRGKPRKVRLQFSKTDEARFLSHLEMARVFARAARRAALMLRYSEGYHPQPRIAFGPALSVGFESLAELVDIELVDSILVEALIPRLNNELPQGMRILSGTEISLKNPAISDSLEEVCYSISGNGQSFIQKSSYEDLKRNINGFLARENFPAQKQRKGKKTTVDIRPMVKNLFLGTDKTVEVILRFPEADSIRLGEILGAIWDISEADFRNLRIAKTSVKLKQ